METFDALVNVSARLITLKNEKKMTEISLD